MSGKESETDAERQDAESGMNKVTSVGDPLWLDALKSTGQGLIMLVIVLVLGGALAVAIILRL